MPGTNKPYLSYEKPCQTCAVTLSQVSAAHFKPSRVCSGSLDICLDCGCKCLKNLRPSVLETAFDGLT